ncbi:hypothetical protein ASG76_12740 [Nocardioides sp. Soil774]|uniref:hypothetical protein n=1 Tax=Nocardioides sp. Soil774 TaxID=1736408 RepID=UPI0006F9B642|nr:hypothetical protein [Nocardioides sp. Soil774]KRE94237.1 hypothetical protein ASG76_12740 [Nocardioides sp. Soil774]
MTELTPEEEVAAALVAFRATLEMAQGHLARVAATPVHTREEREQLHRDALAGALGPDMERLARLVDDGETSWGEVFEGSSPHAELLHSHLDTMEQRYAEDWKRALEDDPTFDPRTVEEEVRDEMRAAVGDQVAHEIAHEIVDTGHDPMEDE